LYGSPSIEVIENVWSSSSEGDTTAPANAIDPLGATWASGSG
jgi:hypothetical protein